MVHSTKRRPVSKMAAHEPKFIRPALQELRRSQTYVLMRCSMEAIAANTFFIIFVRQSVEKSVSRQGVMEGGVKYGHVWYGREEAAHLANPCEIHRVVQWSERAERFNLSDNFAGDNCPFREFFSTMNNSMRNDTNLSCAANDSFFF